MNQNSIQHYSEQAHFKREAEYLIRMQIPVEVQNPNAVQLLEPSVAPLVY